VGYVLGSFPTSIVVGRVLKGIDIREHGSGNAGATNVVRVLGFGLGLFTGFVDILKGAIPVLITKVVLSTYVVVIAKDPLVMVILPVLSGFAAVLGHAFPLFAGFRGGKGVATGAGVVLAMWPMVFLFCLGGFVFGLFLTGIVSVGSLIAAILLPTMQGILLDPFSSSAGSGEAASLIIGIIIMITVIYLHRSNLSRLIHGREHRFERVWLLHGLYTGRADRNGEISHPPRGFEKEREIQPKSDSSEDQG
jgi:glycerol-3-phosphate acyltransferase PlsY